MFSIAGMLDELAMDLQKRTILNACLSVAADSSCKKMGFGCVATLNGDIVHIERNEPLKHTAYICQNKCIRDTIKSRTHSMIGACAHAEERILVELSKNYSEHLFPDFKLFVAGVQLINGEYKQLAKTRTDFSCIRCATKMALYNISGIHIYRTDLEKWKFINTKDAIEWAYAYAQDALDAEVDFA